VVAQVAQVAVALVKELILLVLLEQRIPAAVAAVAVLGRWARLVAQVVLELLFSASQAQGRLRLLAV